MPAALQARRATVALRRYIFARSVGNVLDTAGIGVATKFHLAGAAMEIFSRPTVLANLRAITTDAQHRLARRKVVAMAVLRVSASITLDYDAERALRGVMRGVMDSDGWNETCDMVALLSRWLG